MDKNKFWLGGRLFNTASPRLGARTQRKASSQDGRPNARKAVTKRTRSLTKGKARGVGKRGTQTQCKASWQDGRPNTRRAVTKRTKSRHEPHEVPQRNARTAVTKRTKSRNENDHGRGH